MKQTTVLLILIFLVLASPSGRAQTLPTADSALRVQLDRARAEHNNSNANLLKLTPEQKQRMAEIRRNWAREWGETARRLKEARRQRKRLLEAVLTDEQRALRDQLHTPTTPGSPPEEGRQ